MIVLIYASILMKYKLYIKYLMKSLYIKLKHVLFLCIQMYTIIIHINKFTFKNVYYICVFVNLHLNGRPVKEIYGV